MNRNIAHAASTSMVVGGLAAGLVLALAASSLSTEPAAHSLRSIRRVSETQICGYDPLDWSVNRMSACTSNAVNGTVFLASSVVGSARGAAAEAISDSVQTVDNVGEYAAWHVNRLVENLGGFADRTVARSLTIVGNVATKVEETADDTVKPVVNTAIRTVLDTRNAVSETAVNTTGTVTNVAHGGVSTAQNTADGVPGTVDCVRDIPVGDLSINRTLGCS